MNYEHAGLDLETLDTDASSIIVSIGCVAFDPERLEDLEDITSDEERGFYATPDMDIQALDGRTASTSTIQWWIEQGPAAKNVFSSSIRRESPQQVCDRFTEWVRGNGIKYLWGYGNMFDNLILRSFYGTYKKPYPFGYRNDYDIRTLEYLAGKRISELGLHSGTAHNAFDDALNQARSVQHLFRRINTHGAGARIAVPSIGS